MSFLTKDQNVILRQALSKLADTTQITSVGPGSIARALTEVITKELGDLYAVMDFNVSMAFLSTASGRALDLIGELYDVRRKILSELAVIDQTIGAFNFYVDTPAPYEIVIPAGTQVTTDTLTYVGDQYLYNTTDVARIPAGRTRVFVSIRPAFADSVFTAGENTLVRHGFASQPGVIVKCTNLKAIPAQVGFESDEAFRIRLIKAVRIAAGGTEQALRFAALGIAGVRDVKVRTAPYGLGSFEVVITPENAGITATLQVTVAATLDRLRPVGVRMFVKTPNYLPIDVQGTISVKTTIGVNKQDIARRAEISIMRYVNTLLAGDPVIYNRMIQEILDSSDQVTDVVVSSFKVNGAEVLRRNVTCDQDEQLIPGNLVMAYTDAGG